MVYIFGGSVRFPVEDITPTYLTNGVLSTLRQADFLATEVLHSTNTTSNLSQMPVIIIPVHFDRDPVKNSPSCQRSIVIRTFITNDFMTGIAATPNKNFPAQVSWAWRWMYWMMKCGYIIFSHPTKWCNKCKLYIRSWNFDIIHFQEIWIATKIFIFQIYIDLKITGSHWKLHLFT